MTLLPLYLLILFWVLSRPWVNHIIAIQKEETEEEYKIVKPTKFRIFWSEHFFSFRSSHPEVFYKISVLKNFAKFTGKNPVSLFQWNCKFEFCKFILTETSVQVFSCEFCEISKNTFCTGHVLANDSAFSNAG